MTHYYHIQRLEKCKASSERPGALPAIVSGAFDGGMLCDSVEALCGAERGGLDLLRVLLFRKFLGVADTNGRNILVGVGHVNHVLSVDETAADPVQLERSLGKGLQTAQVINATAMMACHNALLKYPSEIAAFIRTLRALALPAVMTAKERLTQVHAKLPFDDETCAVLEAGEEGPLKRLSAKLALGGGGGVGGKRKR